MHWRCTGGGARSGLDGMMARAHNASASASAVNPSNGSEYACEYSISLFRPSDAGILYVRTQECIMYIHLDAMSFIRPGGINSTRRRLPPLPPPVAADLGVRIALTRLA